jgi:putative endonuclease
MWNYNFYVYITTNWNHTILYIGVTNDLKRRIFEHRNKLVAGFTQKFNVNKLVYYEHFSKIDDAIKREKNLKRWRREWKIDLISNMNPDWRDLFDEI